MNKLSKTLLIFCSTFGISFSTADLVRASSFTANRFNPFIAQNLENVDFLVTDNKIDINTEGNLNIVTDPNISVELEESEPILGVNFSSFPENITTLTIDVGKNLNIFGKTNLFGGDINIDVDGSIVLLGTINSNNTATISITSSALTIGDGGSISSSSQSNNGEIIIKPVGGVISLNPDVSGVSISGSNINSGGNIVLNTGNLTLTSVPESTPISGLLLMGVMGSALISIRNQKC